MLDVRLRRNGRTRQWTISEWAGRWSCRYAEDHLVSYGGCTTLEWALAKKTEWQAQIAAARADGWS
jgi:hypothetical protein